MKDNTNTRLTNPNDQSSGQCWAPVEKGTVNILKKKHYKVGEDPPRGWVQAPCSIECPNQ